LKMYAQAEVPVLGLVENMSYFICPHCGERHEIFQHSQRWRPEALKDMPMLGRIPLTAEISKGIDQKHPLMADSDEKPGAQAEAFLEIARGVKKKIDEGRRTNDEG